MLKLYWSLRHQISLTHEGSYGTTRPLGPVPAVLPVWRHPQAGSGPQQCWRAEDSSDDYEPPAPDISPAAPSAAVVVDLPLRHYLLFIVMTAMSSLLCVVLTKLTMTSCVRCNWRTRSQLYFIAYAEDNVLPPDNKLARQLIFESQDYVMDNELLFHLYYPRGRGHRTEI